jgi:Fe2+ or Zn2+ uptake regulation protein
MAQRRTKQRSVIEGIIETVGRPLTRAELWEEAKAEMPSIGFATVSRAVNDLLAEGILISLQYPGQSTRYEKRSSREHPHILCHRTNRIYDLAIPMPPVELPEIPGMKVTGYEVLFFGEVEDGEERARRTDG